MIDALALSTIDWWETAGVDVIVDESPRNWLAAPRVTAVTTAPVTASALPATLAAFRAWLLADASVPGPAARRLDAAGDPDAGTMVIVDMPEIDDHREGGLLGGEIGARFDRMIGAIGLAREAIYLAPFSPARPTTGLVTAAVGETLARLMTHHIALARPRRLLLLGDAPTRGLLKTMVSSARGQSHMLTIDGRTIPMIATWHPRLVSGKSMRETAWADLQLFKAAA